MKANIYIHIGLHKTGTTSIQATLFKNRKKLLAHGINYLPLNENHSTTLYPLFADAPHRYLPNRLAGLDTEEKAAKKNSATDAALRRMLESNACSAVIISGEDLSGLPAEGLQRLKDRLAPYAARFRIIVYVREPYATVTSMFQQRLRSGQTYGQTIRRPPRPGYPRIGTAIQVFGRENVDIRIFDPAGFVDGDLVADFLSAIDADSKIAKELEIERANVALSYEAAYLMQEINRHRPQHRLVSRRDIVGWLEDIPGRPYRCPPRVFAAAQPLIAEDLKWLRDLLGKEVFRDGQEPPPAASYWQKETLAALAVTLNDLVKLAGPKPSQSRGFVPWLKRTLRRFRQ